MTTGTRDSCPYCKEEMRKERIKRQNARRPVISCQYVVVYDPDPEWGYNVGAVFMPIELHCMCQQQNHSLTPNMILRKGDRYYKVKQDDTLKQRLIELPPENIRDLQLTL